MTNLLSTAITNGLIISVVISRLLKYYANIFYMELKNPYHLYNDFYVG